jgi:hypothetical protein
MPIASEISSMSVHPVAAPPRADRLRHELRRARPALGEGSPTFMSAMLLLLGREIGPNIDRLSRLTGYPRDFVAKCARRLYDNGVWEDGRTVCEWSTQDDPSFWADVEVAEGKLYRQSSETGCEWAPIGQWRKSYDFVDRSAAARTTSSYHCARVPPAEEDDLAPAVVEVEDPPVCLVWEDAADSWEGDQLLAAVAEDWARTGRYSKEPTPASEQSGAPAVELFPDAVWLQ